MSDTPHIIPVIDMPEDGHEVLLCARLDKVLDIPVELSPRTNPYKLILMTKYAHGWAWCPDIGDLRDSVGDWILENIGPGKWVYFPKFFKEQWKDPGAAPVPSSGGAVE